MPILEALIGPVAAIIDKVIPDKGARDKAKLELSTANKRVEEQLSAARTDAAQRLADDRLDRRGQLRADLRLLRGREHVDDAVDGVTEGERVTLVMKNLDRRTL